MATFDRFELRGQLGHGGFATVYRAYDTALGREVALKVLHPHLAAVPSMRERFVREGESLGRINHPNVVRVLATGEAGATAYLVTELIEGRSLAAMLDAQGSLPAMHLLPIVRQVANALAALHAGHLVHRDVKPDNILVEQTTGRAVLLDLGVARALDAVSLTSSDVFVGTPGFMAPEQLRAGSPVTSQTDVYQLGATIYTMLTGQLPFSGDPAQVLTAVLSTPPPDVSVHRPDLSRDVAAVIARAMAKEPAWRQPGAPALVSELEAALNSVTPRATFDATLVRSDATLAAPIARLTPQTAPQATISAPLPPGPAWLPQPAAAQAATAAAWSGYQSAAPRSGRPRMGWLAGGVAAVAVVAVALVGMNSGGKGDARVVPGTGTPAPPNRSVVVSENFNNRSRPAFPVSSDDPARYERGYDNGEYVIRKLDPTWQVIPSVAVPAEVADATIALDARLVGETRGRFVAIACRSNQAGQYRFVVEPAKGSFTLLRFDGRGGATLAGKASDAIRRGNEVNHMEMSCVDGTIAVSVNGTNLATVQDATHQDGDILFGTGSLERTGATEGRFDNLVVTRR
jgi:hypothetical protein